MTSRGTVMVPGGVVSGRVGWVGVEIVAGVGLSTAAGAVVGIGVAADVGGESRSDTVGVEASPHPARARTHRQTS